MSDDRDNPVISAPRRRRSPHGAGRMMPGEKPRDFKGTVMRLIRFMGRFKVTLVLVMIFSIASTVFNIIGPKVLSEATTLLFNGAVAKIAGTGTIDFPSIATIILITLAIYCFSAVCTFIVGWIMSYISQKTCYDLREAISKKIDRIPFGYYERTSTGDVLSRITNDVDTLGQSLNQGITQLITSITTVVGVLVMMLMINWIMTLIALVMIPISLILVSVVVKRSQKYFYAQQDLLGAINGQVEETFSGHTVVKAFCHEKRSLDEYLATNEKLYEAGWKSQFLSGLMPPIMGFVGNLGYVAVAFVGSIFAVMGTITVGDIQAFIQYVRNFTQPITQLAQVANVLQSMAAAAERIFGFLDSPEEGEDTAAVKQDAAKATAVEEAAAKGAVVKDAEAKDATEKDAAAKTTGCSVCFDHVHFGYDPEKPIINDFTACVEEGQTVAIVGPTGAGKTTMVKLLMRFYDVQSGSITIDGVDIRDMSRDEVRSSFGMVLQDTWLFSGSVRENIRYGRLDATDEEIIDAAKRVRAHRFITTLPGGYDFEINEDASNISAGQRQLITIARALLADRRMLILDEATSSVDTRTEQRIQDAMDALMKDRTSFVIAHRLSTIRSADLILVMNHGDIVEQGTHEELLSLGGFYADLYNSQFRDTDDGETC